MKFEDYMTVAEKFEKSVKAFEKKPSILSLAKLFDKLYGWKQAMKIFCEDDELWNSMTCWQHSKIHDTDLSIEKTMDERVRKFCEYNMPFSSAYEALDFEMYEKL